MLPIPPPDKEDKDELQFEYDKLRTEILQNEVIAIQLLGATLLLVTAVMGFILNGTQNTILRVLILSSISIITYIALTQTFARIRSTFLMASYIRIFIEPYTKYIKWETRLERYRDNEVKPKFKGLDSFLSTYALIIVASTVLILMFSIRNFNRLSSIPLIHFDCTCVYISQNWITIPLSVANIAFSVWVVVKSHKDFEKSVINYKSTYDPKWNKVKSDLII